jgi:hypothetical protein
MAETMAARATSRAGWHAKHDAAAFTGGGKEDPERSHVQTSTGEVSMWLCVPAAACKKWHLDPSTTTVNNDHQQRPWPNTGSTSDAHMRFHMRSQRHQSKERQSRSLSLHDACKISRTERVSARSNWPWSNVNEHHHI